MKEQQQNLTQGTNATPVISLTVDPQTLDILKRLHQAGMINLGANVLNTNERLSAWEYDAFQKHMVTDQRLRARRLDNKKGSTAQKRLWYVRFMEEHPVPVRLRPPEEESWREHVAYRLEEEGVSGHALNDERKALKSLLRFLGLHWPSLDEPFAVNPPHWTLPPDELIPHFWETNFFPGEPLRTATVQHVLRWDFFTGVRPPSELAALNLSDIDFANRSVVVTEIKKGGRRRTLDDIEPFVITAPNAKSLQHYVEHIRPQLANEKSGDACFLNEKGERWDPKELAVEVSKAARTIWPAFVPYTARRWYATNLLVETNFNVYVVAQRLGDTVKTVEAHYLEKAKARAAMKGRFHVRRRRLAHV